MLGFSAGCDWLKQVDSMCIECHEGFGASDLQRLAKRFKYCAPQRLPGIWLLSRKKVAFQVDLIS
jgi:hypothetical protein